MSASRNEQQALMGLLQLTSPNLPVGAFSYSQGLENAVDSGLIHDAETAGKWITDCLKLVLGCYEAPVWLRLYEALSCHNHEAANNWNEDYLVTRETAELSAEAHQMGYSAARWLESLDLALPAAIETPAFITAHVWACHQWQITSENGLNAYLFAWAENQIMAAMKSLPMGQAAGQKLLFQVRLFIPEIGQRAATLADEDLSNQAPGFALSCCQHETQYSRLFRS